MLHVAAAEPLVRWGPFLLIGGIMALFACSRALVALLVRGDGWLGARAIAYALPVAAVAIVALLLGHAAVAVGVVFGSSVAAVTTAVGYVALAGPVGGGSPRARRLWPFLLAAALLVFVAGFKGTFNWRDALALIVEGLILVALWTDRDADDRPTSEAIGEAFAGAAGLDNDGGGGHTLQYASAANSGEWTTGGVLLLTVELGLVGALLWLGGWAVTHGTINTSPLLLRGMSPSAMAGSVVGLGLVMPMMYGSWRLAGNGRGWAPVTTQIAVVLINLCAILPVLILIPYLAAKFPAVARWSAAPDALYYHEGLPRLLLFPSPMWRVDNVVLVIMGVFLLPVSLGKWSLGREEGAVLMAGYFFYLTAVIASGFEGGLGR